MGIYNTPTIYNQESNSFKLVDIKNLTDDWVNITNEFSLYDSNVYKANNEPGDLSDLNILFSKKLKLVYFDCYQRVRICKSSAITSTGGWNTILKYNGNKFNVPPNGGKFTATYLLNPDKVNRGQPIYTMCHNGASTNALCRFNYGRDWQTSEYGLCIRALILDPDNQSFGVLIGQCVFEIEPN